MQTELLTSEQTQRAAEILRAGGLVAIPTETVYGLAANALDGKAVARIFSAKGRPQDNPLIVHIADMDGFAALCPNAPENAYKLARAFWPGPLTIIVEKPDSIPDEVSAGLSTVAVRMPSHPIARKIISEARLPLAAPSANLSGKPSPTAARHVIDDLGGRIEAVLDGGECEVGVESTVITLCTDTPRILRPGAVTPEQIEGIIGKTDIDDAVLGILREDEKAASPGMKYKHYSPSANVIIVEADGGDFVRFVNEQANSNADVAALVFDEERQGINCKTLSFGSRDDDMEHAKRLFAALRQSDGEQVKTLYVHCPSKSGVGLAVMNRLLRAAEFKVIKL